MASKHLLKLPFHFPHISSITSFTPLQFLPAPSSPPTNLLYVWKRLSSLGLLPFFSSLVLLPLHPLVNCLHSIAATSPSTLSFSKAASMKSVPLHFVILRLTLRIDSPFSTQSLSNARINLIHSVLNYHLTYHLTFLIISHAFYHFS